jgi:hypothetical protein
VSGLQVEALVLLLERQLCATCYWLRLHVHVQAHVQVQCRLRLVEEM